MYKFSYVITLVAWTLFASSQTFAQTPGSAPLLIGRVAIDQHQIAFTYAGKIWLVDRTGGTARPLDDSPNDETNPVFSPDGKQIAFSRSNGNDFDVYVASAVDGKREARRLTFQAQNDLAIAWTLTGREIVFQSTRDVGGINRFYKIAVENGALEEALPLPQAYDGSYSPDGTKMAYNPRDFRFGEWRYYRGGYTAPIWIADLKTGALEKLPNQNYNDRYPMWIDDKIYTVSDRTGVFNLFAYDLKTKQANQLTKFNAQGIRAAGATGDAICFVQGGRLHLFDLASGQDKAVNVSVSPDKSELRPRTVSAVNFLDSTSSSAGGEKIALGARGEVILFDTVTAESKNLTNSSSSTERYPVISPDGKSAAYFSDDTGEYMLHLRSLATDVVKRISIEQRPSFYMLIEWSPDSKKLVFSDRRLNLWLADVDQGTTQIIDTSTYSAQESWQPNWSPDSRFVAYAKRLKNRAGTVFIYDSLGKKTFQITDGVTHTESPVFDKNGKYLYLISSLNALTSEFRLGILSSQMSRPAVVRSVQALLLTKEVASPVLPNGKSNADAKVAEAMPSVKIDSDNLARRFIDMPTPQRDYAQVIAGKPGKLLLVVNEWSQTPGKFEESSRLAIYLFNLANPERGMEKIVDGFDSVEVTRDGNRILYQTGNDLFLTRAEAAAKPGEGKLDLSKVEVRVDPAEEWRQILHESMRIMRDWFYDPNYHGQNLNELEKHFATYLPTVTRRADLNRLVQQMLGAISVSHLTVAGGDTPAPAGGGNRTGLLGADYEIANGHYRFKKIYRSTNFAAANGSSVAPLDRPGLDVEEGDYLLEVNGQKLETTKNLFSYFENTAGMPIQIVVSPDAGGGAKSRTFTVYPASAENSLRLANWAENNRRLVEKKSGGRLGYVYIESYLGAGVMKAIRGLAGYADKQGVIIDQRFNAGGYAPDYLIGWMQRDPLYYYLFRGGEDLPAPANPAPPVKVMLINERNGSAAETGPFMFKLGKVGALVGKRTARAGIGGYFFTPSLLDGGTVQLPNRAAYNPDGSGWGIENSGVTPDYDVEITPQDLLVGKDPQLEKAIEVAMARIGKNPPASRKHPAFPIHPGK